MMKAFKNFTGLVAPLDRPNVDTDQIIPKQFLKAVVRSGLAKGLFFDWRNQPDSQFVLNQPRFEKSTILVARANFGCGSSREHPSVGLAFAGVKAVICKSVNRIFYRSSVNQGLPILVVPKAIDNYKQGDAVDIDFAKGIIKINEKEFHFSPLPEKLMAIFNAKGLVNYVKSK